MTATATGSGHLLGPTDLHLFNEGTHARLFEKLGAHPVIQDGIAGFTFAVWAPNARAVALVGDFNGWSRGTTPLTPVSSSGIWSVFVPSVEPGARYKFAITSNSGEELLKADPFAFAAEVPPATASIATVLDYTWSDDDWMATRQQRNALDAPMSIYEMHIGSWRRGDDNRILSYRELAEQLPAYLVETGYTHVEFLPLMEHPFYGSWGYQTSGYFAATSRFGSPQDLMFLVDSLHRAGIGVILDWVPSHFPRDEFSLARFDGTHLYEHADPRRGVHKDWDSLIFNYGRHEVRSFLLSSATYWLDVFHADGLRVDAVASMLYLDYSRNAGEWEPNIYGGREDLEAVSFLRQLNETAYDNGRAIQVIAEESTAWPSVSRPTYTGGLGFGLKWDMGWMHDTLKFMAHEPIHRRFHYGQLTFRGLYGFTENFVLALSHDEVVHGKGSLINKMPGDEWQKFANMRLLFSYMYALPGKKLMFMGGEFGQWREWSHESSLDWHLLDHESHRGLHRLTTDLNRLYRESTALHQTDLEPVGFEWIDCNDSEQTTLSFLRKNRDGSQLFAVICNFTPVPRANFRLGVPAVGHWREVHNSDSAYYAGSGQGNLGGLDTTPVPAHGRPQSLVLTLPPLATVIFEWRSA